MHPLNVQPCRCSSWRRPCPASACCRLWALLMASVSSTRGCLLLRLRLQRWRTGRVYWITTAAQGGAHRPSMAGTLALALASSSSFAAASLPLAAAACRGVMPLALPLSATQGADPAAPCAGKWRAVSSVQGSPPGLPSLTTRCARPELWQACCVLTCTDCLVQSAATRVTGRHMQRVCAGVLDRCTGCLECQAGQLCWLLHCVSQATLAWLPLLGILGDKGSPPLTSRPGCFRSHARAAVPGKQAATCSRPQPRALHATSAPPCMLCTLSTPGASAGCAPGLLRSELAAPRRDTMSCSRARHTDGRPVKPPQPGVGGSCTTERPPAMLQGPQQSSPSSPLQHGPTKLPESGLSRAQAPQHAPA